MSLFMAYLLCSAAPPTGDFGENVSLTAKSPDRVSVFQTARDDSTVTPQKPSSCIENALHKDVFGVISGTGNAPFYTLLAGAATSRMTCQIHTAWWVFSFKKGTRQLRFSPYFQRVLSCQRQRGCTSIANLLWNSINVLHKYICVLCPAASPHSSTPNISAVHHADSRGSLISTDSGNSLLDKSSDKTNSLEKVDDKFSKWWKTLSALSHLEF